MHTAVMALVLAAAWGQDPTTQTPKPAGVEVKVTRIQENRSREFVQDKMMGQMSGMSVSLALTGGLAGKAVKYGKLKIEKAVDDKDTDLSLKDDFFGREIIEGFIVAGNTFGPKIENGFAFDIRMGLAKREAAKIAQLQGSISVISGGKSTSVVISDPASLAGKEVLAPELKAAGVTLKIKSVKDIFVMYTMTDGAEAVKAIELVDADGKTVPTCTNSYMMDGSKEYTLQANKMPAKPSLKVTLVTGSTTTTVPFDLKDIPLP